MTPTPQEIRPGRPLAISPCGPERLADVHQLHRELVIDAARLLALVDSHPERRALARFDLAERGGFLHEPLEFDRHALEANVAMVSSTDEGGVFGYCTALNHLPAVQAHCSRSFGWSRGGRYLVPDDLPGTSAVGTLEWTDAARALAIFNRLHLLAVGPELAVGRGPGRDSLRRRQTGTALLLAVAARLPPGAFLLGEIFAIERVNGVPVSPPLGNLGSERVMAKLGGAKIGLLREHFSRDDGISLVVAWGLWLLPVDSIRWPADTDAAA